MSEAPKKPPEENLIHHINQLIHKESPVIPKPETPVEKKYSIDSLNKIVELISQGYLLEKLNEYTGKEYVTVLKQENGEEQKFSFNYPLDVMLDSPAKKDDPKASDVVIYKTQLLAKQVRGLIEQSNKPEALS